MGPYKTNHPTTSMMTSYGTVGCANFNGDFVGHWCTVHTTSIMIINNDLDVPGAARRENAMAIRREETASILGNNPMKLSTWQGTQDVDFSIRNLADVITRTQEAVGNLLARASRMLKSWWSDLPARSGCSFDRRNLDVSKAKETLALH